MFDKESSKSDAWKLHWESEGLRHVNRINSVMLFGWEGYSKNGNGFNDIVETFDTVDLALAFVNSPYMTKANFGTLQVIDMKNLSVLSRFERQRQTDKWSRVA